MCVFCVYVYTTDSYRYALYVFCVYVYTMLALNIASYDFISDTSDYSNVTVVLTFSNVITQLTVEVAIIDDAVYELDEDFNTFLLESVELERDIVISPDQATVTITDDDGTSAEPHVCAVVEGPCTLCCVKITNVLSCMA